MDISKPKILVVSNNCFSRSGSNGRTLANFFIGWPHDRIAQFYIQPETPDSPVCRQYYRVTDREALRALVRPQKGGGKITPATVRAAPSVKAGSGKKIRRSPITLLLRNWVWNSRRWQKGGWADWVDDFSPDMVLLQAGDSAFMLRLSVDIAEKYQIPLLVYNSEDYYFKRFNYLQQGRPSFFYTLFRRQLSKQFVNVMNHAAHCVYNSPMLRESYAQVFSTPSTIVMTASTVKPRESFGCGDSFTASYLGNLGVGRHEPLIELARALAMVNQSFRLDIYGEIPNEPVKQAFEACPSIRCHGRIRYDEVVQVMHKSDLLVHVENFSGFYQKDLRHAFSTKIADSLASGTCLLVYAPDSIAAFRYLEENKAACLVSTRHDLEKVLRQLWKSPALRQSYADRALLLARKNHDEQINTQRFQQILLDVCQRRGSNEGSANKRSLWAGKHR